MTTRRARLRERSTVKRHDAYRYGTPRASEVSSVTTASPPLPARSPPSSPRLSPQPPRSRREGTPRSPRAATDVRRRRDRRGARTSRRRGTILRRRRRTRTSPRAPLVPSRTSTPPSFGAPGRARRPPPRDTSRRDPNASRRPSPPRAPPHASPSRSRAENRRAPEGKRIRGKTAPATRNQTTRPKTTTFGAVFLSRPFRRFPLDSRLASRLAPPPRPRRPTREPWPTSAPRRASRRAGRALENARGFQTRSPRRDSRPVRVAARRDRRRTRVERTRRARRRRIDRRRRRDERRRARESARTRVRRDFAAIPTTAARRWTRRGDGGGDGDGHRLVAAASGSRPSRAAPKMCSTSPRAPRESTPTRPRIVRDRRRRTNRRTTCPPPRRGDRDGRRRRRRPRPATPSLTSNLEEDDGVDVARGGVREGPEARVAFPVGEERLGGETRGGSRV